jgi:PAS domain S-box-containing protein
LGAVVRLPTGDGQVVADRRVMGRPRTGSHPRRWLRSAVAALAAALLPLALALAQEPAPPATQKVRLTAEEQAWIAAHPVIHLGSDPVWAPIDFLDAQGAHQGMTADYMALLNAKLGLNMVWDGPRMTWPEVLQAARDRHVDVVPTAGKTPEREEYLTFTEPPYVSFRSVIVVRDDEPFISGIEDLKRRRIALVPGYAETADFDMRFPGYNKIMVASVEAAMVDVAAGRADAAVSNLAVVNWTIRTKALTNLRVAALYTDQERSVHLAVRKDWPQLVGILNKGLAAITLDEHARIRNRWYEVQAQQGLNPMRVLAFAGLAVLIVAILGGIGLFWVRRLRAEVAERMRAVGKLEATERLLRNVTDNIPVALYQRHIYADGRVVYPFLNAGFYALGDLVDDATSSEYGSQADEFEAFHPDDRQLVADARAQATQTTQPYVVESRMRLKNGDYMWTRGGATPSVEADGSVVWNGYAFNITERKETEARLQEAEKLLRQVTDNAPGFFFQLTFDTQGNRRYNFVSRGIGLISGYEAEEVMSRPNLLFDITHPDDAANVRAAWDESRATGAPYRVEYRIRTRGGEERWLRGSAAPSPLADGSLLWNGFTIDISAERKAEDELAATQYQLKAITDNMPGAAFEMRLGADGMRVTFVSAGIQQLIGLSSEELRSFGQIGRAHV